MGKTNRFGETKQASADVKGHPWVVASAVSGHSGGR